MAKQLQILYHGRFQHEPINDKVGLQPDVFDVYNHSYRRDHRLLPFEPIEIFVYIFSVFRIQKMNANLDMRFFETL